jgi:hypothetical protein
MGVNTKELIDNMAYRKDKKRKESAIFVKYTESILKAAKDEEILDEGVKEIMKEEKQKLNLAKKRDQKKTRRA